jgi:arylsulfatase A-like enzyme
MPYNKKEEYEKLKKIKFWLPLYLKNNGYETISIDWIGLWFKKGFNYYDEKKEIPAKMNRLLKKPIIKKILLNLSGRSYTILKKIFKRKSTIGIPSSKEMTDTAIKKISETEKPFFLFIHYADTHFPFPHTPYKSKNKKNIKQIYNQIKSKSQKEYFKKRITDINLQSKQDIINKYDASIKKVDQEIGRIHEYLKKTKKWENTIFIILADHGESLFEHKIYFSHSGLFDDTINVPLIIHLPKGEHKTINHLVQNIDITPTILEVLGDKKNKMDGKSLIQTIKKNKPLRKEVYSYDGLSKDIKCTRTKNKKTIIAKNNRCNLCKAYHHQKHEEYDLEKDPLELNNLALQNNK